MNRLRYLLDHSPVPQYVIAGELGIHPTSLSDYANGKKIPGWRHRLLLCNYFGLIRESDLLEPVDHAGNPSLGVNQ